MKEVKKQVEKDARVRISLYIHKDLQHQFKVKCASEDRTMTEVFEALLVQYIEEKK